MKRFFICIILSMAISLCACQPTPDHDIIVNKAESTIPPAIATATSSAAEPEESQEATIDTKASRMNIPDHVKRNEEPLCDIIVNIDADVEIDPYSSFPVLEMAPLKTADDIEFRTKLIGALCPNGKIYKEWMPTKDDFKEELNGLLNYHGQADAIIEIDQASIRTCEENYRLAPEESAKVELDIGSKLSYPGTYYVMNEEGKVSRLNLITSTEGSFNADRNMLYYEKNLMNELGMEIDVLDSKLSGQEAAELGAQFLDDMGIECSNLVYEERGYSFHFKQLEWMSGIWMLRYCRKIEDTESIDKRYTDHLSMPKEPSTTIGAAWGEPECVELFIGDEGILCIIWSDLAVASSVVSMDVPFCDFDEIVERMISQLGFQFAYMNDYNRDSSGKVIPRVLDASRIRLVYGLISEKDKHDAGLYVPLWEITFNQSDDENGAMAMYFSAIDGGTVEPRMTTSQLMSEPEYTTTGREMLPGMAGGF